MAPFLALAGFMGSGKSSIGIGLSDRLGWDFVDLDQSLEAAHNTTIADFFATRGEAAFRQCETNALKSLLVGRSGDKGLVVALGGGTLESSDARELLSAEGGVVLLDIDADEAWERVRRSSRPLARNRDSFGKLLASRRPTYEATAHWVVPVGGRSIESITTEIASLVAAAGSRWQDFWGRRLVSTARVSLVIGGPNALDTLENESAKARALGKRLFVLTDSNVARHWGDLVRGLLGDPAGDRVMVIQPGEGSKSVKSLECCWNWLAEQGARRDDIVVALGGGVVGDLAGFAAATYQRGMSLWQIPTSLLAQVDAGVGGKTAVNLNAGKNLVGAFYQPDMVVADARVLATLPERVFVSGMGEVIKHALLISEDEFSRIQSNAAEILSREPQAIGDVVKTSVFLKARVVQEDERESGHRAVLNLGHTIAHAMEVTGGYGTLSHGEAVSVGLMVALAVSEAVLGLPREVRTRTGSLLRTFGLPTQTELPPVDDLLAAAGRDKKVRAGTSGFVGLRNWGEPVWGLDVPRRELEKALEVVST